MHPKDISILEYNYLLPADSIAAFPPEQRGDSKLLVYKNGIARADHYKNIAKYLPARSLLVFNNTRVIPARILFEKSSGSTIEIFCLEPYQQLQEYSAVMNTREQIRWKCFVGGAGKWKEGLLKKNIAVGGQIVELQAALIDKLPDAYVIEFCWQPTDLTFSEIIEQAGETPLPPYIKRKPDENDKARYQTIYAKHEGSVAAPTAGLHFTPEIFSSLSQKKIELAYLTLHVGAGTFKPVKAALLEGHLMHAEWIELSAAAINDILEHSKTGVVAVGTTAVRAMESLYWMGIKAILHPGYTLDELAITQWEVYEPWLANTNIRASDALSALLNWMMNNKMEQLITRTQILIAPGYTYKIPIAIITNFHQPQSTLLLLIAAAIGENWKRVYKYALENDFRFLSYGDGSLLFLNDNTS